MGALCCRHKKLLSTTSLLNLALGTGKLGTSELVAVKAECAMSDCHRGWKMLEGTSSFCTPVLKFRSSWSMYFFLLCATIDNELSSVAVPSSMTYQLC